jgi:hypothetical protein
MRIRLDWLGPYGPCDEKDKGEVEDYLLVVVDCLSWDFTCDGCVNLADLGVFVTTHWLQSPCTDPD